MFTGALYLLKALYVLRYGESAEASLLIGASLVIGQGVFAHVQYQLNGFL